MTSNQANILLVEDSPSLATVYQGYLEKDHYRTSVAGSGADALEFLEKVTPDVVLLDLVLPDMSGMDVLKTIHERGFSCSVVIVSSSSNVSTIKTKS